MFSLYMSGKFKVGQTELATVNKQPTTVFWRDVNTLVLNGTDVRRVLHTRISGALRSFIYTEQDGTPDSINVDFIDGGVWITANR